jgi:ankyrin repeat protein
MGSLQAMADAGWALGSVKDSAGKTPLHRAAQVGNAPAVELLIKYGTPCATGARTTRRCGAKRGLRAEQESVTLVRILC